MKLFFFFFLQSGKHLFDIKLYSNINTWKFRIIFLYNYQFTKIDYIAILSTHNNAPIARSILPTDLHIIEEWTKKWRIKISKSKSNQILFIFMFKQYQIVIMCMSNSQVYILIVPDLERSYSLKTNGYKNQNWRDRLAFRTKAKIIP